MLSRRIIFQKYLINQLLKRSAAVCSVQPSRSVILNRKPCIPSSDTNIFSTIQSVRHKYDSKSKKGKLEQEVKSQNKLNCLKKIKVNDLSYREIP